MKCKDRKELNNRLKNIKYLKISLNVMDKDKDKEEIKRTKREINKVERAIEKVKLGFNASAGNILYSYYFNDLSLQEITEMYGLSYEVVKHRKAAAITYIYDNKLL